MAQQWSFSAIERKSPIDAPGLILGPLALISNPTSMLGTPQKVLKGASREGPASRGCRWQYQSDKRASGVPHVEGKLCLTQSQQKPRPTALLIANSRASRLDGRLAQVISILSKHLAIDVVDVPTDVESEQAVLEKIATVDRVLIGGGDGTLHHLLPLMLQSRKPVAVLPLGTANDLAKSIGVPADIASACAVAYGPHIRSVDIGMMNGKPFFNVASLGLAATVSKMQTPGKKRWLRAFSYAVALTQAIKRSRPFHAEILVGDKPIFDGYVLQASIGNGRYHGGGLSSGPNARIDDSLLHIYTVAARRWWQLLPVIPVLIFGLHGWARSMKSFDVTECTLLTRRPKRATVDGELLETKGQSFHFEVMPQMLTVFVPPAMGSEIVGQSGNAAPNGTPAIESKNIVNSRNREVAARV